MKKEDKKISVEEKSKLNKLKYLALGLVISQVLLLVFYFFFVREPSVSSSGDSSSTSLIPIWFVALIPLLTAGKQKELSYGKRKNLLIALLILGSLVSVGILAFVLVTFN